MNHRRLGWSGNFIGRIHQKANFAPHHAVHHFVQHAVLGLLEHLQIRVALHPLFAGQTIRTQQHFGDLFTPQFEVFRIEIIHAHDLFRVPIRIKTLLHIGHHVPCEQHIHIREIILFARIEISIAQIAPAGDAEHAIGQPHFDVHAPAQGAQIGQKYRPAGEQIRAKFFDRIEHPHLDVRMRVQHQHILVAPQLFTIIQQHPHAHATLRRRNDLAQQQPRAQTTLHIVILQIQAVLRVLDQRTARSKRLHTIRQRIHRRILRRGLLQRECVCIHIVCLFRNRGWLRR